MYSRYPALLSPIRYLSALGRTLTRGARHGASDNDSDAARHFFRYFSVHIAVSDYERRLAFLTRHQVYCEELKYLPKFPNRLEQDEFDGYAIHFVIRHRSSGACAGTVRLVLPRLVSEQLPVERFCKKGMTNPGLNPEQFKRQEIVEISRLAVPQRFRQRNHDSDHWMAIGEQSQSVQKQDHRQFPYLALALHFFAITAANFYQIPHGYVAMSDAIARHFSLNGLKLTPLGKPIDYFGSRRVYHFNPCEVLADLPTEWQQFNEVILGELEQLPPSEHRLSLRKKA